MPRIQNRPSIQIAQLGTGPLRAPRLEPPVRNPNHPPPLWIFLLGLLALCAIITAAAIWIRRRAYRAWTEFARSTGGEFRAADAFSPRLVSGELRERPFLLETATSHEDEAGYHHTRVRVPIKNRGSFILGLRRKSFLEAAQTRGQAAPFELDDPEFEKQFFIYCNDAENLANIIDRDARRELLRYPDVEIYIRMGEMEWRRAGEQADIRVIRRLTDLLLNMAAAIDEMPSRGRSLTQVLADEKMIEKGV